MRRPDHDPASIRATRMRLRAAQVPVLAIGIAMSPQLVELMYDDRYRAVGVLASLFCIGAWLSTLASSYGVVLLAAGKPKFLSLGNAAKLILLASAIGFVVPRFGVVGAALVVSLSELGLVVVSALACRPLGTATIGADLGLCVAVAALVGIFLFVHRFVLSATSQPLAALGTVVALGLGATGVVARRCRLL
jgi:O-antigen/teichoic acid export membrane protein